MTTTATFLVLAVIIIGVLLALWLVQKGHDQ